MIPFGDGTHSRGDPDIVHLTFIQKSKCGGGWARVSSSIHTKGHQKERDVSSGLFKKKRKEKNENDIKKERKEERGAT